jgi:hypothetical protein
MAPNTTDTQESVTEQFQKLDLKKLAREHGRYQVFPKVSVRKRRGIMHVQLLLITRQYYSTLLLNPLYIMMLQSLVIPRRLLFMTMLKRSST